MKVAEILQLAQSNGAQIGSPYQKELVIQANVEGVVTPALNAQGQPTGGWRFTVKDESGELSVPIASQSYAAGKNKYDLVVAKAIRDVALNNGNVITKSGDKRLRAM